MSGVVPPLPEYALMAWYSVKAQGQLYLLRISSADGYLTVKKVKFSFEIYYYYYYYYYYLF
jgi:uncharacterized membrane protein (GlpM family)